MSSNTYYVIKYGGDDPECFDCYINWAGRHSIGQGVVWYPFDKAKKYKTIDEARADAQFTSEPVTIHPVTITIGDAVATLNALRDTRDEGRE